MSTSQEFSPLLLPLAGQRILNPKQTRPLRKPGVPIHRKIRMPGVVQ